MLYGKEGVQLCSYPLDAKETHGLGLGNIHSFGQTFLFGFDLRCSRLTLGGGNNNEERVGAPANTISGNTTLSETQTSSRTYRQTTTQPQRSSTTIRKHFISHPLHPYMPRSPTYPNAKKHTSGHRHAQATNISTVALWLYLLQPQPIRFPTTLPVVLPQTSVMSEELEADPAHV